jgi:hypothetical protein
VRLDYIDQPARSGLGQILSEAMIPPHVGMLELDRHTEISAANRLIAKATYTEQIKLFGSIGSIYCQSDKEPGAFDDKSFAPNRHPQDYPEWKEDDGEHQH